MSADVRFLLQDCSSRWPLPDGSLDVVFTSTFFEFLPYTMANGRQYPAAFLRGYLKLPLAWRIFGKQFLVVGARR